MVFIIHPTAEVSVKAKIGRNTKVWNNAQVRENAVIGSNCIISKNAYIDFGVRIGNNVKIQNNASIYHDALIEDGVFIGPHVCLTNDKTPRAITKDGKLKNAAEWRAEKSVVSKGASIGACSVLLPGIKVGEYAMIGAGSVVTKDVRAYTLVYGNPAREHGYVCKCGFKVTDLSEEKNFLILKCPKCNSKIKIKK